MAALYMHEPDGMGPRQAGHSAVHSPRIAGGRPSDRGSPRVRTGEGRRLAPRFFLWCDFTLDPPLLYARWIDRNRSALDGSECARADPAGSPVRGRSTRGRERELRSSEGRKGKRTMSFTRTILGALVIAGGVGRGGGYNGFTSLDDAGPADFKKSGYNLGGGVGVEVSRYVTLRGDFTYGRNELRRISTPTGD